MTPTFDSSQAGHRVGKWFFIRMCTVLYYVDYVSQLQVYVRRSLPTSLPFLLFFNHSMSQTLTQLDWLRSKQDPIDVGR